MPRWTEVGFPPACAELGEPATDVHVWLLDLNQAQRLMSRLRGTLDARERKRASALVFQAERARYTAAHGLVREVLGSYLGLPPAEVTYQYGKYGKPYVVVAGARVALRFNSSRSANLGLCAVALDRDVGVDIERIRVNLDHSGIAKRYFSSSEHAAIRALPADERVRAFYDCWTRKEAHLKARGYGLALPLHSFEVPVVPDPPRALVDAAVDPQKPRLTALPPVSGFAAALATVGGGGEVTAYRLDLSGPAHVRA